MLVAVVVGIAYMVVSPLLGAMAENGWINKDAQAVSIMIVLLFGAYYLVILYDPAKVTHSLSG